MQFAEWRMNMWTWASPLWSDAWSKRHCSMIFMCNLWSKPLSTQTQIVGWTYTTWHYCNKQVLWFFRLRRRLYANASLHMWSVVPVTVWLRRASMPDLQKRFVGTYVCLFWEVYSEVLKNNEVSQGCTGSLWNCTLWSRIHRLINNLYHNINVPFEPG